MGGSHSASHQCRSLMERKCNALTSTAATFIMEEPDLYLLKQTSATELSVQHAELYFPPPTVSTDKRGNVEKETRGCRKCSAVILTYKHMLR